MNSNIKHLLAGAVCMECGTIFAAAILFATACMVRFEDAWYEPMGRYFSAMQRNSLTLPFTLSLALALLGFIMLLWGVIGRIKQS